MGCLRKLFGQNIITEKTNKQLFFIYFSSLFFFPFFPSRENRTKQTGLGAPFPFPSPSPPPPIYYQLHYRIIFFTLHIPLFYLSQKLFFGVSKRENRGERAETEKTQCSAQNTWERERDCRAKGRCFNNCVFCGGVVVFCWCFVHCALLAESSEMLDKFCHLPSTASFQRETLLSPCDTARMLPMGDQLTRHTL